MKTKINVSLYLLATLMLLSSHLITDATANDLPTITDEDQIIFIPAITIDVHVPSSRNGPIVFIRSDNIWKVEVDGNNATQLTFTSGYVEPAWARQGDRIAYVRQLLISGKDAWEVGIYNLATAQSSVVVPAQLTGFVLIGNYYRYSNPRWSPDGRSLYYLASDGRVSGDYIHKVNVQTGARDQNFSALFARRFDIAPLTGRILFTDFSNYPPVGYFLNLANPDGSQKQVIVPLVEDVYFGTPRWSPDERGIAVIANGGRYGSGSIARFDSQGTFLGIFPQQISAYSSAILDWSSDGLYLIYDSLDSLHKLNILTVITETFTSGSQPSCGPPTE